jgi:hypothetical protein
MAPRNLLNLFRFALLMFGGCLLFACGASSLKNGSAARFLDISELKTPGGKSFRVMHALEESDLQAWEASERQLSEFVDYWASRGVSVGDNKITIAIMPNPKLPKNDVLRIMYGADFRQRLEGIRVAVRNAAGVADLRNIANDTFCEFPPLLSKFVAIDDSTNILYLRKKMLEFLDAIENPSVESIPGFKADNAFAGLLPNRKCGALVLGRSSGTQNRGDAFGAPDIVQHEMGHLFHGAMWQTNGKSLDMGKGSVSLSETLADIFAHSFTGDPCHNKLLAPNPETGDLCARMMDKHAIPLRQAIVNDPNGHANNAALRHFLWILRGELGQEQFAKIFVSSVYSIKETLENNPPRIRGVKDGFLLEENRIVRDIVPTETFARDICLKAEGSKTCQNIEAYLGADVSGLLAEFRENAPTRRLNVWQSQLVGGVSQVFRFVRVEDSGELVLEMKLSDETIVSLRATGFSNRDGLFYLSFVRNLSDGSLQEANWSSKAALSF